ncbi:hypothetical protein E0Z10_g7073 [Xylaria hypoxylon]|uniref:Uncharacterized protein n=1 Tax=Xylaria hypoxylon TaxID=37992 RepID=A0A4Z0YTC8_9PEZI|nr:hypothetical protein E0Z10_g7073 [Xylaria hypoxylon]
MASSSLAGKSNDRDLIRYLATTAYKDITESYQKFENSRPELLGQKAISPRIFQKLVAEHVIQILENRTFCSQQKEDVWNQFSSVTDTKEKTELKKTGDAAVQGMNKYDGLLRRVVAVVKGSAPRVNWKKHTNNKFQETLGMWLQGKHQHFGGLLSDSANSGIKSELEIIQAALAQGLKELKVNPEPIKQSKKSIKPNVTETPASVKFKAGSSLPKNITPVTATPKNITPVTAAPKNTTPVTATLKKKDAEELGSKRPPSPLKGASPPKKSKKDQSQTGWWGPQNSRLDCSDEFFGVIGEWKAFLANPTSQPGTKEYRNSISTYLRQALDEVDKRSFHEDLLLKNEWNFRDANLRHVRGPSFISPGCPEANMRIGFPRLGYRGSNDFKRLLGGGLTAQEKSDKDSQPWAQGMLALAHSYERGGVSLRGGAGDGDDDDDDDDDGEPTPLGALINHFQSVTDLHFQFPEDLWDYLVEDATYPSDGFKIRFDSGFPMMTDPNRVPNVIDTFRSMMAKSFDTNEMEKVQDEKDVGKLEMMFKECTRIAREARQRAYDFIYKNPDKIFTNQPKLNADGGKDKPKARYGNIRDRHFAKPLGYAFRARGFQVICLWLCYQLHILDKLSLEDILLQHLEILHTWDVHEELYMEWENNRWFSLSDPYEIAQLEARYEARWLVRQVWAKEKHDFQEVLKNLQKDPNYYNHASVSAPSGPGQAASSAPKFGSSTYPVTPESTGQQAHTPQAPYKAVAKIEDLDYLIDDGLFGEEEETVVKNEDDGDNTNLTPVKMKIDSVTNVTGGANGGNDDINDEIKIASTNIAIEALENILDVNEKALVQLVEQNNELDNEDPGNHAIIHRNNIDIMSKNQAIWNYSTEIYNLKRSVEPLTNKSYGKGAEQKWELPVQGDFWANTRQIPKKKELPLGVTSIGLGSMPGEHPSPDHPRVLVGCKADFGDDVNPDEESIEPAGSNLFGTGVAGTNNRTATTGIFGTYLGTNPVDINMGGTNIGIKKTGGTAGQATGPSQATEPSEQIIESLSGLLKEKNKAELTIKKLLRVKSGVKPLTPKQKMRLESARKSKKEILAVYKQYWNKANAATRAQVDLIEQEEDSALTLDIQAAEALIDKQLAFHAAEAKKEQQMLLNTQQAMKKAQIEAAQNPGAKLLTLSDLANVFKTQPTAQTPAPPLPTAQPKTQPQDKPAETSPALKDAEKGYLQVRTKYREGRAKYEKAKVEAAATYEAVQDNIGDVQLEQMDAYAQGELYEVAVWFREIAMDFRVATMALEAQKEWDNEVETADDLRGRLDTLDRDLAVWADDYEWDNWDTSLEAKQDQWVIESIEFMHESFKAVGINAGYSYWNIMYRAFWDSSTGNTLARKRKIWLYSLVGDLNQRIVQETDGHTKPFIDLPPVPPAEWKNDPPSKEVLIEQAEEEEAKKEAEATNPAEPSPSPAPPTFKKDPPPPPPNPQASSSAKAKLNLAVQSYHQAQGNVPESLAKKPAFLDKKPAFLSKKPAFLAKKPAFLEKLSAKPLILKLKGSSSPSTTKSKPPTPATPATPAIKTSNLATSMTIVKPVMFHEDGKKLDAWPDLKNLIQVSWNARVAYDVLQESRGADYTQTANFPQRKLWPRPSRRKSGGNVMYFEV